MSSTMYRQSLEKLGQLFYLSLKSQRSHVFVNQQLRLMPQRSISYYDSKIEEAPEKYTAVEKSYEEFKFVEKLLPKTYVPECPSKYEVYPSGWRPPKQDITLPYHVPRTRNHLLPVYYCSRDRGQIQFTKIKNVEGNIWILEREIGKLLKRRYPSKTIMTHVHESSRYIHIRGDFEEEVKDWLLQKGF